jgi:hypothetical protein
MEFILLWSFIAYGMSTILVYGSIFEKPRNWIKTHSTFFGELIGCIMCTSTWVGFFLSICLGGLTCRVFDVHWTVSIFFDGVFTTGIVWAVNTIVEHFE